MMKSCPRCRANNLLDARFCSNCALPFTASPKTPIKSEYATDYLKTFLSWFIGLKTIWQVCIVSSGVMILSLFAIFAAVAEQQKQREKQTASVNLASTPKTAQTPVSQYVSAATTDNQVKAIEGKVVGVQDGDTITVLDGSKTQHKIRLAGIDAPEPGQDFGEKAKQNLSALIFGKTVQVLTSKTDKYGRPVGKVLLKGEDISLRQIKDGFAWHYKEYQNEQSAEDRKLYAQAELDARDISSGLWLQNNVIAPWEFRKNGNVRPEDRNKIFGNKNSLIYHWAGCPGFAKISGNNRVIFNSSEEAEGAGYRAAKNCPSSKPILNSSARNTSSEKLEESSQDSETDRTNSQTRPTISESRSTGSSSEYITGPRGGCYYINGNGKKTYVDRSLCSGGSTTAEPSSAPRTTSVPSSSRYIRGPRGGCYYINSRGNKTYVDRSLCN